MWYLAEILFAEPSLPDRVEFQCESCNVVFFAPSAVEAYRKAVDWGLAYAGEPPASMRLLGVSNMTTIGKELGDGTEICGRFFKAAGAWSPSSELIPPPGELKAILWEQGQDTPLGELLSPEKLAQVRRAWGEDADCG